MFNSSFRPCRSVLERCGRRKATRTLWFYGPWILLFLLLLFLLIPFLVRTSDSANSFVPFNVLQFYPSRTSQQEVFVEDRRLMSQEYRPRKLNGSRVAICLVGAARRFELTGPTIIKNILLEYPEADLFVHSPLDGGAFKLSILHAAPRIAGVRIFEPEHIEESEVFSRVVKGHGSPKGIQGLLQYFNLVEGCLTMIQAHESSANFRYDWIVRTRVDGYWAEPLDEASFVPRAYVVPSGSHCGGLNDRLGIGDRETSVVALSRLSLIPRLDAAKYRLLNSEKAFKAQLVTSNVAFVTRPFPFCILSERTYPYPPREIMVSVASIGSPGPLSGIKCRPCKAACVGDCVVLLGQTWVEWSSWNDWRGGVLELCDPRDPWEEGWEDIFDEAAGREAAVCRKQVESMGLKECLQNFERMRQKTVSWDSPPVVDICHLSLFSARG